MSDEWEPSLPEELRELGKRMDRRIAHIEKLLEILKVFMESVVVLKLTESQKEVLQVILEREGKTLDQYATEAVLSFLEASLDALPDNLREKMK